ncbi:MAG: hypothetical protein HYY37_03915 [Candidatus Aenigmarchaeota archaeon]|nr:hypothetical protein [Candidatus Aenigmarchaeota archaeon]
MEELAERQARATEQAENALKAEIKAGHTQYAHLEKTVSDIAGRLSRIEKVLSRVTASKQEVEGIARDALVKIEKKMTEPLHL